MLGPFIFGSLIGDDHDHPMLHKWFFYTYFSTSIHGDDRGMIYDCFNMFQPLGESILGLLGGELPT